MATTWLTDREREQRRALCDCCWHEYGLAELVAVRWGYVCGRCALRWLLGEEPSELLSTDELASIARGSIAVQPGQVN